MKFIFFLIIMIIFILKFKKEDFKVIGQIQDNDTFKNCCKVSLVFDSNKKKFVYKYEKLNECKYDEFVNNNTSNLFVDGINNWSQDYCKEQNNDNEKILGACKNFNFSCKDFSRKEECNKFGMEWFPETCRKPYHKPLEIKYYDIEKNNKEKSDEFKINFDTLKESSPDLFNKFGSEINEESNETEGLDASKFDIINFKSSY